MLRGATRLALAAGLALALGACSEEEGERAEPTTSPAAATTAAASPDSGGPSTTPTLSAASTVDAASESTPATAPSDGPPAVRLEPALGAQTLRQPVEYVTYPGGRVLIADRGGTVTLYAPAPDVNQDAEESTLLDLSDRVLTTGREEGLLSVALDPAFSTNGRLYAYYSAPNPRRTVLSRFEVVDDAVDLANELVILEVEQPYANHNGGAIRFGPDGLLYLGLGDGGSGGDPHGNGQNPGTLLGSIIRIDVREATSAQPYTVPPDNPGQALEGARPEMYAYGFRNPWRMSFDPETDALWAADVGQGAVEEVDVIEGGGNYGWNILEGSTCYEPPSNCSAAGTILPVAEYSHDEGCSVTGGVVYRGDAMPALRGYYLYGDFCSGRLWAVHTAPGSQPVVLLDTGLRLSSFGVDQSGEVYLLGFDSVLHRLAPAPAAE